MTFDEWLTTTRQLQRESFGVDPASLEGAARADYIRWNALAVVDEVHEALFEVQWKPWAKSQGEWKSRDEFVGEIVDVMHFIANLLVTANCTGEELSARYREKQNVNRKRQETPGGYDSLTKEK